jgi:phosphocarrier protein HPr
MAQNYSTLENGAISVDLEIKNQKGLHARAAAAFVKCAEQFDADVTVERIGQEVSGCSIMGLMMLAAAKGTIIHVRAKGNQAQEAIEAISNLVNCKFGED